MNWLMECVRAKPLSVNTYTGLVYACMTGVMYCNRPFAKATHRMGIVYMFPTYT